MRIVVYTAIFGHYDKLRPPSVVSKDVEYVLFTDDDRIQCSPWKTVAVLMKPGWLTRTANRHYKLLPHRYLSEFDFNIYHDGNIEMIVPPERVVELLGDGEIAMEKHQHRDCSYAEARTCIDYKFCNEAVAKEQIAAMRNDGFPEHFGLTGNHFMVRRNTPDMARLGEMWWWQIEKYTARDQISFMHCLWKLRLTDKLRTLPQTDGHRLYIQHRHG